jgi:hypothetical protein
MSEQTREFTLGDLYTVTSGKLVGPGGISGIYETLSFLTGDDLFTHQLSAASDAVTESLIKQLPFLAEIEYDLTFAADDPYEVRKARVDAWLDIQNHKYGEFHTVKAVPEAWGEHDPMDDLCLMVESREVV